MVYYLSSQEMHQQFRHAPVAQLDRVFGYEPKGRGFESLLAYQEKHPKRMLFLFFCNFLGGFDLPQTVLGVCLVFTGIFLRQTDTR